MLWFFSPPRPLAPQTRSTVGGPTNGGQQKRFLLTVSYALHAELLFIYLSVCLFFNSSISRAEPGHPAPKVQFQETHPCVDEGCQCRPEILLSYQSLAKHFTVNESVVSRIMEDVTDIIIQTICPQLICFSVTLLEPCTPFPLLFDVCKTPASISLAKASPSLVLTALVACWRTHCRQSSYACQVPEFLNSPFSMSKAGITISSFPRKLTFKGFESHSVPHNSLPFMLLRHAVICDYQSLPVPFGEALQGLGGMYRSQVSKP